MPVVGADEALQLRLVIDDMGWLVFAHPDLDFAVGTVGGPDLLSLLQLSADEQQVLASLCQKVGQVHVLQDLGRQYGMVSDSVR